jgi:hypothetical protein
MAQRRHRDRVRLVSALARARGCDVKFSDSSGLTIARVVGTADGICRKLRRPVRRSSCSQQYKPRKARQGNKFATKKFFLDRECDRATGLASTPHVPDAHDPDMPAAEPIIAGPRGDLKRYNRQTAVSKNCCQSFDRCIIVVVDLDAGSIKSARTVAASDWREQGRYR